MIIRTLFTELSMVNMFTTITYMTTHFLLTMISSFTRFTNVLGLRLFQCLSQLPHKFHRIVSLCWLLLCFFLSLSLHLAFSSSLLISPLLSLYFNPSLLTASLVHALQSSVAFIFVKCIGKETH